MKHLFCVKGPNGKPVKYKKEIKYFDNKTTAKLFRKDKNGLDEEGNEVLSKGYTVSYGPDHKKYTGG